MFRAQWTDKANEQFTEIRKKAERSYIARQKTGKKKSNKIEGLLKQITKTIQLLLSDPQHPGLHTHKYHSITSPFDPSGQVFEAYVQNKTPGAYRVFWCYGPEKSEITIIAITPHP